MITPGYSQRFEPLRQKPGQGGAAARSRLGEGLRGFWPMSEGGGVRANDHSGRGAHGKAVTMTAPGPLWGPSFTGGAADFGDRGGYYDCGVTSISGTVSMSAWVYTNFTTTSGIYPRVMGNLQTGTFKGFEMVYAAADAGSGITPKGIYLQMGDSSGTLNVVWDTAIVPLGKWTHYVATFNSADGIGRVYRDGVLRNFQFRGGAAIAQSTAPLAIGGASVFDANACWRGLIDQVAIWDRLLSDDEVWRLYSNPYCLFDERARAAGRGYFEFGAPFDASSGLTCHPALTAGNRRPSDRDRAWAVAATVLGDVPRANAQDQLPATRPVYHTPLALPDFAKRAQQDRAFLAAKAVLGDVVRPDAERVEIELPHMVAAPPPRALRRTPPLAGFAIDAAHLLDQEQIAAASFDRPMGTVVLPRRPTWPPVPGSAIVQNEVFPEDPIVSTSLPWHTPMPAQPPRGRRPTQWLPGGVWVAGQQFAAEQILVDEFSVQMGRVVQLRSGPPKTHMDGLDQPTELRAESVHADALGPMDLPGKPRRPALGNFALVLLPDITAETPHPEAYGRVDLPVALLLPERDPDLFVMAHTEFIVSANFAHPLIPRIRRDMLAAGFWRARK